MYKHIVYAFCFFFHHFCPFFRRAKRRAYAVKAAACICWRFSRLALASCSCRSI